ncbi:GAF domain-containing protein [Nocardioides sp. MAHUQ-72]|uniref:GAF domain-containing sensor histidine kinase n=1 Tax=unclassified Nocardioides TaxID=2615069 RepID=UPI00360EFD97
MGAERSPGSSVDEQRAPAGTDAIATAVLDAAGVIVWVNDAWVSFCKDNGGDPDECGPGTDYLAICAAAGDDPEAQRAAKLLGRALRGELPGPVTVLTPCPGPGTSQWTDMYFASHLDGGKPAGAVISFAEHPDLEIARPRGQVQGQMTHPPPQAPAEPDRLPSESPGSAEETPGSAPGTGEDLSVAGPDELLTFPDVPRLELEDSLVRLTERASEVLKAQGRLRALLRANALVSADLKLEVVLDRLVRAARDLVGARYAALAVLGEAGTIERFVHTGMSEEQVDVLGREEGQPAMTGFLGVPVHVRGSTYGTLYLTDCRRGAFSDEDEQLVSSLARTASVAIENALLYEDSERRRRWQAATTEATQLLFAGGHDTPLEVALQGALHGADGDVAVLAVLEGDEVVGEAAVGLRAEDLAGRHVPLGLSRLGQVLLEGRPLLVETYRDRDHPEPVLDQPVASLIAVPLVQGPRLVGAVVVGRIAEHGSFDSTDLDQLEAYVGHASVALELNQSRADQAALAVLREHQRIAADLHDHVIQELFATGMGLQSMVHRVGEPEHQLRLGEYVDAIDATIRRIRTTIFRLSRGPSAVGGLKERLLAVVEESRPALGFAAHAEFSGPLDQVVSHDLAEDVVAVAREALANAARHAGASSVRLQVTLSDGLLTVRATDDGRGLGNPTRSSGLSNLSRRARQHGGTLEMHESPGGGTHLCWTALVQS